MSTTEKPDDTCETPNAALTDDERELKRKIKACIRKMHLDAKKEKKRGHPDQQSSR